MSVSNKEDNSNVSDLFNSQNTQNSQKSLSSIESHVSTPTSTPKSSPKSKRTTKESALINSMITLQETQAQEQEQLNLSRMHDLKSLRHVPTPPSRHSSLSSHTSRSSRSSRPSLSPPPSNPPSPPPSVAPSFVPTPAALPAFLSVLSISPAEYRKIKLSIKYAPIRNLLIESDIEASTCCICLDPSPFDDDKIVICDLCYSAVHQKCYGKDLAHRVPEGEWHCERCIHLLQHSLEAEDVCCLLCPELEGIIFKWSGDEDIWVHPMCVDWMKELSYADEECRKIVGRVNQMRFELKCYICKVHRGACIQCNYTGCTRSFHVCCAVKDGLIRKDMEEYKVEEEYNVFCKFHVKKGLEEIKVHGRVLSKTKREEVARQSRGDKDDENKNKKRGRKRRRNDE